MPPASRLVLTLLAAALLAGSAPAAQQTPAPRSDQPPIRTEATFVRVDVYPTRDGRPVDGLTQADFEILEDGVLQQVQTFEHVVLPTGIGLDEGREPASQRDMLDAATNPRARVIVVFLDAPHVSVAGSHTIVEPLIELVRRVLGPDDLVGLMTPSMSASQMILARRTQVFEDSLRRNWDWGQASDQTPRWNERETQYFMCYPPRPGEGDVSKLAREMIAKSRESVTLEALQDLVGSLGGIREERKAIIAVSQGWLLRGPSPEMMDLRGENDRMPGSDPITVGPTGTLTRGDRRNQVGVSLTECDADRLRLASMDNQRTFRDLLADANRANASFYPIDPRGLVAGAGVPLDPGPLDRLRELAGNTDGLAIVDTNDLHRGVRRIVDDLTSYYLLGYNSTNAKLDGRFRRIQVRVKQPGIQVRARRGYRAALASEVEGTRSADPPPAPSAFETAMGALARISADARFRISVAGGVASGGGTALWIAGELPVGAGGQPQAAAGGSVDLEVQAGDRSERARVVLEPGERSFVTAVKIPTTGGGHVSVRGRFTTPGSTEPLTDAVAAEIGAGMAQPLVFRRGPSTGNHVRPAAVRRFSRTERVRLELPVSAATSAGTARLLDRTGQPLQVPVTLGEKTDATGQRWITADLVLAPLAAGDYAIELAPEGMEKSITAMRVTR